MTTSTSGIRSFCFRLMANTNTKVAHLRNFTRGGKVLGGLVHICCNFQWFRCSCLSFFLFFFSRVWGYEAAKVELADGLNAFSGTKGGWGLTALVFPSACSFFFSLVIILVLAFSISGFTQAGRLGDEDDWPHTIVAATGNGWVSWNDLVLIMMQ